MNEDWSKSTIRFFGNRITVKNRRRHASWAFRLLDNRDCRANRFRRLRTDNEGLRFRGRLELFLNVCHGNNSRGYDRRHEAPDFTFGPVDGAKAIRQRRANASDVRGRPIALISDRRQFRGQYRASLHLLELNDSLMTNDSRLSGNGGRIVLGLQHSVANERTHNWKESPRESPSPRTPTAFLGSPT